MRNVPLSSKATVGQVGNTEADARNALSHLGLNMVLGEPIEVTADSGQEGIVLAQGGDEPTVVIAECPEDRVQQVRGAVPSLRNRRL